MIFWFSATGNSQYAAEKIASAENERLISIGTAFRDGHYDFDISNDNFLGFVIPTFASTLPAPAAMFIEKLNLIGLKSQYVFAVFTCGESTGEESAALYQLLKAKGIPFHNSFDLLMPDNFIIWSNIPNETELNKQLLASDSQLEKIIKKITAHENGTIIRETPKNLFMPLQEISTSNKTSKLHIYGDCTGCGLCEKLCPMSCIKMIDGKPVWEGKCSMCLACLHRCPAAAIDYVSETVGKIRYAHPGTELRLKNDY